jgi:hypothetical protein
MQLGTRWQAHTEAPEKLPEAVRDAISEVERELTALKIDSSTWFWTLTYLENKPVVQLDDGTTITMNSDGYTTIHQED